MKRTLSLAAVAVCLFASFASAQEAPDTMSVSKGVEILNALSVVGGNREEVVGQGDNRRVIQQPYDISSDTRWAVADNISILRRMLESAQSLARERTAAAEQRFGGPLKKDSDEQKKLDQEIQQIFDTPRPVKLLRLKRSDLKTSVNAFPAMTLSSLAPIIDP